MEENFNYDFRTPLQRQQDERRNSRLPPSLEAVISRRTAIRELNIVPEEELDDEEKRIEQDETAAADSFNNEPAM